MDTTELRMFLKAMIETQQITNSILLEIKQVFEEEALEEGEEDDRPKQKIKQKD